MNDVLEYLNNVSLRLFEKISHITHGECVAFDLLPPVQHRKVTLYVDDALLCEVRISVVEVAYLGMCSEFRVPKFHFFSVPSHIVDNLDYWVPDGSCVQLKRHNLPLVTLDKTITRQFGFLGLNMIITGQWLELDDQRIKDLCQHRLKSQDAPA